jgi:hypothetical protein
MGVRVRSDQSVTSGSSLPVVHVGPENRKVVRPRGSQHGSRLYIKSGIIALVLVIASGPFLCAVAMPCPAQTPPPNPTAAEPHGRRVLSRVGVADHEVTPVARWTGSS